MLASQIGVFKTGVTDMKVWRKTELIAYLYEQLVNDQPAILDLVPEGSSCRANSLYRHLDAFCQRTGYPKDRITIRTGNMIEHHDEYRIERASAAWFEVPKIRTWLLTNTVDVGNTPTKHFGHFIGKSNWHRLWIASIIHKEYRDKSFQTFNGAIGGNYVVKNDGLVDYLGLDDLVSRNCDRLNDVVDFLKTCPHIIPEDVEFIKTCIPPQQQDCYPIQFPANFNILQFYNDIFVDVLHETFVAGETFLCTEKSWRPILARRPFIAMGPVNYLANLRRLGFRTFDDFWDEGYDQCGMSNRVTAIEKLLSQIAAWDQEKLITTLADMKEILDHNYQVFTSLNQIKIGQTFANK